MAARVELGGKVKGLVGGLLSETHESNEGGKEGPGEAGAGPGGWGSSSCATGSAASLSQVHKYCMIVTTKTAGGTCGVKFVDLRATGHTHDKEHLHKSLYDAICRTDCHFIVLSKKYFERATMRLYNR